MPGSVFILPNIVRTVCRPLINKLVVVAPPAKTHTKIIIGLVIGIVNVVDGNGHAVAGESETIIYPNKVPGIVIDVSGACCTGTVRSIVPNVLQSAIVDVGNA